MIDKDKVRQAVIEAGILKEIDKMSKDTLRNAVVDLMVERQMMRIELENLKNPKIIVPH